MKKLLGTTLALAMILPSFGTANAVELFKNLKLSGQLDLQGTAARNTVDFATRAKMPAGAPSGGVNGATAEADNNDRIGEMQTRLMLGLDWDLLDDVHAKLGLTKNDRTWGNNGDGAAAQPGIQGNSQSIGAPGTNVLGTVYVDQAYVKVDKVFGAVDTTLGRQYYGEAGDMIIYIGPSDKAQYGLPTNAIDAARFDWSSDKIAIQALAGKFAGRVIGAALPNADKDLTGAKIMIKANENAGLDLYTWNVQTHATGALGNDAGTTVLPGATTNGKNDNLFVTGGKVKLKAGGGWFNGEFAKNWGDNRIGLVTNTAARYKGWMVHADLGYKADVSGVGALTGWGDFGYGTGTRDFHSNERRGFVAVSGDYRPGSIYGRFAPFTNGAGGQIGLGTGVGGFAGPGAPGGANLATNTLSNRVIYGLGFKANPDAVKKLTVGVALWDFHTQTLAVPVGPAAASATNDRATPFSGNKHIGYETDLDIVWKHSDNVTFATGAGRFMPGGIIYEANQSTRLNVINGTQDASVRNGNGTNPALMAYFDVRVKF